MNYSFEYIDIILLAMIAGFIFLRLRGILGKRTGFEGKINPQFENVIKKAQLEKKTSTKEKFDENAQKEFLKGAKIAYETIITDFSDQDNKITNSKPLLSEKIYDHLSQRKDVEILFSQERKILETGGGIANVLTKFNNDAFIACNGDTLWLNGSQDAIKRMMRIWNDSKMDALMMLHSTVNAYGYEGYGDFNIDPNGLLSRRPESEISPYLFTGIQILHPRLFKTAPKGPFSLNLLYDSAIRSERLYGLVHDGEWFHIGTPDALSTTEDYLKSRYSGIKHR